MRSTLIYYSLLLKTRIDVIFLRYAGLIPLGAQKSFRREFELDERPRTARDITKLPHALSGRFCVIFISFDHNDHLVAALATHMLNLYCTFVRHLSLRSPIVRASHRS